MIETPGTHLFSGCLYTDLITDITRAIYVQRRLLSIGVLTTRSFSWFSFPATFTRCGIGQIFFNQVTTALMLVDFWIFMIGIYPKPGKLFLKHLSEFTSVKAFFGLNSHSSAQGQEAYKIVFLMYKTVLGLKETDPTCTLDSKSI